MLVDAKVARLGRGLAACAAVCGALLTARHARAQELHSTLLAYNAPPDCPLVGDFQHSVQRRSARIHFVDEGSHDRELWIVLRKDGDFTVGELRLIEQNGSLRQRSVRFTTCAEAVEGLALIATVSLDPQALLEGPGPVPETPPAPTKPPPAKPPERAMPGPRPPPLSPDHESSVLETKVGAELNAYFLALPTAAPGGSLFLDIGTESRHWLSPLIRGAITHVERRGVLEKTAQMTSEANFALTLASLSLCPVRVGGSVLSVRPCASFSGGALRSWSSDPNDPQLRTRAYVSWGAAGLVFLRLGELVEIVGDVGLGVTVIRDTFTYGTCPNGPRGPDCATVLQTPELYLSSGLGLSLALP